jgi:rhodanese-related sulfurtransferase
VLASIGVRPETSLAVAAGLALGERGGIRVDSQLRTSDPSIYAIGDAVEKTDAVSGEQRLVALAGLANRHGRLVADAISGKTIRVRDALGTAVVGVMGLTIAATGWNEKLLRARGRDIRVIHTHPASHTGYYPGAETMSLKLVIDAHTDEILGAQGIGGNGVDKRIDVISTAMAGGILASELADLELAYAPQFSSAKDPVNMLGYVALNAVDGLTRSIQWHELDAELATGAVLVDVRTELEYAEGAIPGSINIPLDDIRSRIAEIPDRRLIVHCKVGQRGHTAVRLLTQLGRDAVNLDGGYLTWNAGMTARRSAERRLIPELRLAAAASAAS